MGWGRFSKRNVQTQVCNVLTKAMHLAAFKIQIWFQLNMPVAKDKESRSKKREEKEKEFFSVAAEKVGGSLLLLWYLFLFNLCGCPSQT